MLYDSEFIRSLEENPIKGVISACQIALVEQSKIDSDKWTEQEHELLWEASAFIQIAIDSNNLDTVNAKIPTPSSDLPQNCRQLMEYIQGVYKTLKEQLMTINIEQYTSRYSTAFKGSFAYEFEEEDLGRVQKLINEMRELISAHKLLEEGHKSRLLKRLEKLQSELHKRVSDLDRFWGLIGDAGVVLGKFGKDVKPITDRIREVTEIVWKTQATSEELPDTSTNPMLGENQEEAI